MAAPAGVVAAVLVAGMTSLAACPEPQPEEKKLDPKEATKVTSPTTTTATTKPVDTSTVGGDDIPKPAYGVPPQLLYPDAAAPLAGDAGTTGVDASADAPKEAGPKPVPTPTTKPMPVPAYGLPPKLPVGPKGGPGDGSL